MKHFQDVTVHLFFLQNKNQRSEIVQLNSGFSLVVTTIYNYLFVTISFAVVALLFEVTAIYN